MLSLFTVTTCPHSREHVTGFYLTLDQFLLLVGICEYPNQTAHQLLTLMAFMILLFCILLNIYSAMKRKQINRVKLKK